MPGAQKLRNEAHLQVRCSDEDKARRSRWIFCETINADHLVKSRKPIEFVIPAKAGIQSFQDVLDPDFLRDDDPIDLLRVHRCSSMLFMQFESGIWFDPPL